MQRRTFLSGVAAASLLPAVPIDAATGDGAAVMARIIAWYRAFGNPKVDRAYYRSFLTDDYLLLENGELLDIAGDMAMIGALPADHVRNDRFDFRRVSVDGDRAALVYFLDSDMTDAAKGARSRRYLESVLVRHVAGEWRVALLHSTRIEPSR